MSTQTAVGDAFLAFRAQGPILHRCEPIDSIIAELGAIGDAAMIITTLAYPPSATPRSPARFGLWPHRYRQAPAP